jgi:DNA-binding GntR family transcriptional regulator
MEDDIDYAYVLVANDLERRIRSGELPYGAQLRVRGGLTEHYGNSDRTIRRAIGELVERGLVRVLDGKGTFVSWRPSEGDEEHG